MMQTSSPIARQVPARTRQSFEMAQQTLLQQGASCYITRSEFSRGKWRPVTALFVAYDAYRKTVASKLWLYDFAEETISPCEALPNYWVGNAFGESLSLPAFSAKIALKPGLKCLAPA